MSLILNLKNMEHIEDNNNIILLHNKIGMLEEKILILENIVLNTNLINNKYYNDEINLDNIIVNRSINSIFSEPKLVRQNAFSNI